MVGKQESNEPTVVAYHFLLQAEFWVVDDVCTESAIFGPGKSSQSLSSSLRSTGGPLVRLGGWSSMIWTSAHRPSAVKLAVRAVEGVEVEAGSLSESPNDWSEKMFLARFLELLPRCVKDLFMR
jgi:hypothetical protein